MKIYYDSRDWLELVLCFYANENLENSNNFGKMLSQGYIFIFFCVSYFFYEYTNIRIFIIQFINN